MSSHTLNLTSDLYAYLQNHSLRENPVLKELRQATLQLPASFMQISPEQGQLMALLIELLGARKTLDIGTFTGYSALVVALALPPDGKVITMDVSKDCTDMGKKFWEKAGVANKIELKLAPALETLKGLLSQGEANTFDFAFIDADKPNYAQYYEQSLALLRPGGLIAIDNVLWDGKVIDSQDNDKNTLVIRALNQQVFNDNRVSISMLPVGDGLTLARKR